MRPERMRHLRQLMSDQWKSPEELAELSRSRLASMLRYACATVPFYRDFCAGAGLDPAMVTERDLPRFPLVTKQDIAADMESHLNAEADQSTFFPNATGGSTGAWFEFFLDADSLELRLASDLRGRTWAGWNPGDRQAVLWGSRKDHAKSVSLRGRLLSRFVHRSVTLNTYDMSDEVVADYVRQLRAFQPTMILGYASALAFLAGYMGREGISMDPPRGIIASAETLTDDHRTAIEEHFRCKLLNRYGSREFATVAQQCEEVDRLHVINDRVHVEILHPDGSPCDVGERGEIVVTDLDNRALPFIRYRTGDLARRDAGICSCGRGFPLLESVEGRTSELIVGMNGKYYSCQSPRLFGADIPGIGQMQLIQNTIEAVTIRIAPDDRYSDETKFRLVAHMADLLGETRIDVELVDHIPPAPSGKYPFTISKVSPFDRPEP
jgi:phenylacetate-CoA ligase